MTDEEKEIKEWIEERRKGSDLMYKLLKRNEELKKENEQLKEKELSYKVGKVTKAELNKCKTIEEKMEWLGKVLGHAIFKDDMNYAVWVNVQKNNIIESIEKENEILKTELMHLKGCKECKDRPEGEIATVCPTEYEQHCIAQKMTYIKELEAENKDLCESLDIMNNRESELLDQIEKMKCCGNCRHLKVDYEDRYCEHNATSTKVCKNYSEWGLAE